MYPVKLISLTSQQEVDKSKKYSIIRRKNSEIYQKLSKTDFLYWLKIRKIRRDVSDKPPYPSLSPPSTHTHKHGGVGGGAFHNEKIVIYLPKSVCYGFQIL